MEKIKKVWLLFKILVIYTIVREIKTMKIKDMKTALNYLLPADGSKQQITPMIFGFPGIGKSSLIAEIAEERGIQVVDLRLSQHDNTDFKFPVVGENSVKWITADFLPVKGNPRFEGTKGILFLDELNLASQDVLSSVFQLIYDRRVGDNEILDGWHIVAAGNLGFEDGNDTVVEFSTALRDRLLPFILDKFNVEEWLDFVTKEGCSNFVIDYIKANPTKLYMESKWGDEKVFVTPRRWDKLGRVLATVRDNEVMSLLKYVGESFLYGEVAEFLEFVMEALNSLKKVKIDDLFQNYSKYEKLIENMDRDKVFQMNSRITKYFMTVESLTITDKMVVNFSKYVKTLSDDLKVSFLRGMKQESIKVFGDEESKKKPVGIFLKRFFDYDKDFAIYLAELIKSGVGITQTK